MTSSKTGLILQEKRELPYLSKGFQALELVQV